MPAAATAAADTAAIAIDSTPALCYDEADLK